MGTKVFCASCDALYGQYDSVVLLGSYMITRGFTLADGTKPISYTKVAPCRKCGRYALRLDNTTLPENTQKVPEIAGADRLSA